MLGRRVQGTRLKLVVAMAGHEVMNINELLLGIGPFLHFSFVALACESQAPSPSLGDPRAFPTCKPKKHTIFSRSSTQQ